MRLAILTTDSEIISELYKKYLEIQNSASQELSNMTQHKLMNN